MWTVAGLPMHPLIIHAVVILVPLAALGAIAVSVWRWGRDRYGVLVLAASLIAVVATFLAKQSGEQLYDSLPAHSPQMDAHMDLAAPLVWWVLGLFVGVVVMTVAWVGQRRAARGSERPAPRWTGVVHWIGAVATWVFAVASLIVLIRTGDAGARSVWG